MTTKRNAQIPVPFTPVLLNDSNEELAKWAKAFTTLTEESNQQIIDSFITVKRTLTFNTNIEGDYITTGNFQHETVICNNTVPITVTLQLREQGERVTVIRAGTGAVLIDGNGSDIIGEPTQVMPAQYDAADLIASSVEWVLK